MAKVLSNNQILIRECIKQEHEEYDPNLSEDSYFELFCASQILKNFDLDDDELINGITDGANDGGCDGMYVFLNNDLLTEDQIDNLSSPKGSSLRFLPQYPSACLLSCLQNSGVSRIHAPQSPE